MEINNRKPISEYIKQAGAFSILLACFALGCTIQGAIWSSKLSILNVELSKAREERDILGKELEQVKADYLNYKTTIALSDTDNIHADFEFGGINSNQTGGDNINETPGNIIITISDGASELLFDGDLVISLVATPFTGNPLRHKAIVNISSKGDDLISIKNEDVGFVENYGKYRITILAAETFTATFLVEIIN